MSEATTEKELPTIHLTPAQLHVHLLAQKKKADWTSPIAGVHVDRHGATAMNGVAMIHVPHASAQPPVKKETPGFTMDVDHAKRTSREKIGDAFFEVAYDEEEGTVGVNHSRGASIAQAIQGKYPSYQGIKPKPSHLRVCFNATTLVAALQAMIKVHTAMYGREHNPIVEIDFACEEKNGRADAAMITFPMTPTDRVYALVMPVDPRPLNDGDEKNPRPQALPAISEHMED